LHTAADFIRASERLQDLLEMVLIVALVDSGSIAEEKDLGGAMHRFSG
jgi:hypothetical protein